MYLATISSRLLLYDTKSWDLEKSFGTYDGILRDVSWSDDGKYILQVNSKGMVQILTAADHDIRSLQSLPIKDSRSAVFHREGHQNVALGTKSGNVMIWDTKNQTIYKTFPTPVHQCTVNFLSYNAKNTSLAAGMQNGDTIIYGVVSNIPVLTVRLPCSKSISALKFHHDSRSLLGLATDEGHIILRDITTNKDKCYFENVHASPVSDFNFSAVNRDVMLSCGYDKVMHVYDIRLQNIVSPIRTAYPLTSLSINMENQVALGTKNGYTLIYDLRDLTTPFKVLKGHEEEVNKVAFQPTYKKPLSNDISLREDETKFSPVKPQSPSRNRTLDMFMITDTPPKNNLDVSNQGGESKADSFLVMMGLDKSNNDFDDDINKSGDYEKKSDMFERYRQLDAEKNISKVSTPLNIRTHDMMFPSPICAPNGNGINEKNASNNFSDIDMKHSSKLQVNTINMENKVIEELKDFIKLTIAEVADDNKNHFLHLMMSLTKQKLYLEKQLGNLNEQVQTLTQNQNSLLETNRRLAFEIEELKCQRKSL